MDDELRVARALADTALSTDGVHSLGTGTFVEAATYGPNEKVLGVVVAGEKVEVHVVALYPLQGSVPELADRIRERVGPEAQRRRVDVVVEDVEVAAPSTQSREISP